MLQHFMIVPFILGIVVGIVGIYYVPAQKNIVLKYPTPETVDKITYKDKNGICYKYTAMAVDCDSNAGRLKQFPIS